MKKIRSIIAIAIVIAAAASLVSCLGKARLIGTWTNSASVLGVNVETSYTFRSDGTGSMSTALGVDISFTYEVSGGKLFITTNVFGADSTTEYTYSIKGSTLYLTSGGETTKLTKQ